MKKTLLLLPIFALILSCSNEDANETEAVDIITSILINSDNTMWNNTVSTISVEANFNDVLSMDFYINGTLMKSIFSEPFEYSDTFENLPAGENSIDVIAKNSSGLSDKCSSTFTYKIALGSEYQGGVVVNVNSDNLTGTISAKSDLDGGVLGKYQYGLYNGGYESYSYDDGVANTNKFEGKYDNNYAAIACLNLSLNGYEDWYLPAYNEFEYLANFEDELIQSRSDNIYWTSTLKEDSATSSGLVTQARIYGFGRISVSSDDLDVQSYHYVRPFRRF